MSLGDAGGKCHQETQTLEYIAEENQRHGGTAVLPHQERVKLLYEWLMNVDFAPKLFLHFSEAASIFSPCTTHVLW